MTHRLIRMGIRRPLPVLLLCAVAEVYLGAALPGERNPAAAPVLRVLTYNIHHGEGLDGRLDLARTAAIVTSAAPDLVALQEVDRGTRRTGGQDQLVELGRLTGLHAAFGKAMDYQGGAYGVAVLSRTPIRRVSNRRLPGSPAREPRTALTVDVDAPPPVGRVAFTTTHLDQGRDLMDQVAQASYLAGASAHRADSASILAGDLNTRPDTRTMQILARRWTDMFIDPPPDAGGRPRRRIDYVMVRQSASWRTVESRYIDAPLASDHQPVLVVLEWVGNAAGKRRPAAASW
jgi:endonuclease/exonuclease/phosphatase family metal-dependent hydrolase